MKFLTATSLVVLLAAACAESTAPPTRPVKNDFITLGGLANVGTVGFGPYECLRETGKPVAEPFPFDAVAGPATLVVQDNGVLGLNGTIQLNGVTVVTHPNLGGNDPLNGSIPVMLVEGVNTLVCKLEGKPGSGLTMTVTVP